MALQSGAVGLLIATAAHGLPDGAEWDVADQADGCLACHLSTEAAEPGPTGLAIEGLPSSPAAGERYPLRIIVNDPTLRSAGFLLTIRSESGQPGSLSAIDATTEVNGAQARSTWEGFRAVDAGQASWQLLWTAPAEIDAAIRFDLWGNVGNDDLSPLGDSIRHRIWHFSTED